MATCASCNKTILFGGETAAGRRYCSESCATADTEYRAVIARVSPQEAKAEAKRIRHGACPSCGQDRGPVDVRKAHRCMSFLLWSQWDSPAQLSCRRCGITGNAKHFAVTLLFGWWGFPWGLIVTPVQLGRNIYEMVRGDPERASPQLVELARLQRGLALEAGAQAPDEVQDPRAVRMIDI
ncbi:MAG: hypothetical protein AAF436_16290 [Myxococcota bacterium]